MKNHIKKELLKRKMEAERLARENIAKAFSSPAFKKLFSEEKTLMINLAKQSSEGIKINDKKLLELKSLELKELKKLNMTPEDLIPKYTCSKCNDTGVFQGKTCPCVQKIKSEYLLKSSGIQYAPCQFDDCKFEIYDNPEYIRSLFLKMKDWCEKGSQKSVIFSGPTGVGKTFLLECMLSKLIELNKFVVFTTAFDLSQNFLKYHTSPLTEKDKYIENYLDADVLIIDDLGTEPVLKNVTEEYLYLILNQRMFENKPFLISTNLTPSRILDRYGERIFSRLINKRSTILLKIENSDLRLKRGI